MTIHKEIYDLKDFEAWSGAINTKNIIVEKRLGEEFMDALEDFFPDGIDECQLNDLLWFEPEEAFRLVGLDEDGNYLELDEDEEESEE